MTESVYVPDPAATRVRASDADREQAAEALRTGYADGRLTRAELDERVTAAYAARSREQLRNLTADLPAGTVPTGRPDEGPDRSLLCLLLCMCPPAGLAYYLMSRRRARAVTAE